MREIKKIAVLGGGFTGLSASYYLAKKGHKVTLIEKSDVLGGLAVGFKEPHWKWPLERAYHHLFSNDTDIIRFAKEIGFDRIFFKSPSTDSLYKESKNNYRIIPVDSPKGFLLFPYLSLKDKIQAGLVLGFLKFFPNIPLYEKITAEEFTKKYMGKNVWNIFFKELFRKKFGKYAGKILASFLWARIHKRTKKLGYIEEGFQSLIDHVEKKLRFEKGNLKIGISVDTIKKQGEKFIINGEEFDAVVSTLPTPVLIKIADKILPTESIKKLRQLQYLHALVLILETDKPIVHKTYWLNIASKDIPIMILGQHTNLIDKKYYGGNHIAYIGYYLEKDDPLMKMTKEELVDYLRPYLKILNSQFSILNSFRFVGPFAQPIFDKNFLENKPDFKTPVKGFYIANLDMTYPYDRGTNYAVKLGREVADLVTREV